jgi:hypothetical protein
MVLEEPNKDDRWEKLDTLLHGWQSLSDSNADPQYVVTILCRDNKIFTARSSYSPELLMAYGVMSVESLKAVRTHGPLVSTAIKRLHATLQEQFRAFQQAWDAIQVFNPNL